MSAPNCTLTFRRCAAMLIGVVLMLAISATAQYTKTVLTSDVPGAGNFTDPHLVNAWGVAAVPTDLTGGPFWVSDDGTGLSTFYSSLGSPGGLVVTIPPASGSGRGTPTGIVGNTSSDFKVTQGSHTAPAVFLFATLDGTISGWSPSVNSSNAIITLNNSASGAVYTGLAIALTRSGNFIYAADSSNNKVEIYDGNFNFVSSFTDTTLPAGFTPYGIQVISNTLYVTFSHFGNPTGYVNTYDLSGNSQRHLVAGGFLNQPWSIALAPPNFGPMSGALLVGNLGSGWVNAYNASTGAFLGYLDSSPGTQITIDGLWGLMFAATVSISTPPKLYFTAGPGGYSHGQFGVITANHGASDTPSVP